MLHGLVAAFSVPDGVPQGIGIAGLLAVGSFVWKIVRGETKSQNERIRRLETENGWCQWRLDRLLGVVRAGGIAVPDDLWGPPPWERHEATPPVVRRRGRRDR